MAGQADQASQEAASQQARELLGSLIGFGQTNQADSGIGQDVVQKDLEDIEEVASENQLNDPSQEASQETSS